MAITVISAWSRVLESCAVHLEASQRVSPHVQTTLHEIEALSYRTALDLAEIEVASGCGGCPSAPPLTTVQAHLLVLADTLERHAAAARLAAQLSGTDDVAGASRSGIRRLTNNGTAIQLMDE